MRFLAIVPVLVACSAARADRLIDIPTASKLIYGDYRLEYADQTSDSRTQLGYFDVGIGTAFETTVRAEQYQSRNLNGTFDVTYNYISPISGISPGIAFGIQDALGNSIDGRRFFACFTFRDIVEGIGGEFPYDITIGGFVGAHSNPFVGTSIPFSSNFRLMAEHDGIRLSAGLQYQASRALGLRLMVRGNDFLADLSWRGHF